jgi:hypothetical protein
MEDSLDFSQVVNWISPLLNTECVRINSGEFSSLFLGFGCLIHEPIVREEWSLGTYTRSWRIICSDRIIVGGCSIETSSVAELDPKSFGKLINIEQPSKFDLRFVFESNCCVEFFGCSSDTDSFEILMPDHRFIALSSDRGWYSGDARQPSR